MKSWTEKTDRLDPLVALLHPSDLDDLREADLTEVEKYATSLLRPPLGSASPGRRASDIQDRFLSTGCSSLDEFLGGKGIQASGGHIYEISGEAGSGKTQWSLQLALMAALPTSRGGLAEGTIYVNTESEFPRRRMKQIADGLLNDDHASSLLMRRMHVVDCKTADDLVELTTKCVTQASTKLEGLVAKHRAGLVIVDSIAAVFRPEMGDDAMKRAPLLWKIASRMKELGNGGVAVVVVNQVTDCIGTNGHGYAAGTVADKLPALGMVWSMCVNTRIMLSRTGGMDGQSITRRATVLTSSYLREGGNVEYLVTASGVEGMPNHQDFDSQEEN